MNAREYLVSIGEESRAFRLEERPGGYQVTVDGRTFLVDSRRLAGTQVLSFLIEHASHEANVRETAPGRFAVFLDGERHEVEVSDHFAALARKSSAGKRRVEEEKVLSPMPGHIVAVEVKPGEIVEAGRPVVIVEAMKMQNEIAARYGGKVHEVRVQPGQVVETGAILLVLRPDVGA